MFEPQIFRKLIYFIEESTCDIAETFRHFLQSYGPPAVIPRPHGDSASRELYLPCSRGYAPGLLQPDLDN